MPLSIRNLAYIRSLATKEMPDIGQKLAEALQSIADAHNNVEQQTNGNGSGNPQAPPQIHALSVTAQNGHFQVAITDHNQNLYRGVQYFVEHADNPNFTNPHIVHMGTSRNMNLFLGNTSRYWRAYSSYPWSGPSSPVYHGGAGSPAIVSGGGSVGGPGFATSQGSGTGAAGVGISGPGPIPYRTTTGKPPVR